MTSLEKNESRLVAIVTGANSGVGFGIVQRLLEIHPGMTVVLACRNYGRASRACTRLLAQFPTADIHIELVDLSSVQSVLEFSQRIIVKYPHVNSLFLNAASLSTHGIRWGDLFWLFFKDPVGLMESSSATLQVRNEFNADGMCAMFASNVFGHYVMTRELEPLLEASGGGRIMWTSSPTAEKKLFNSKDWQGLASELPYEASKWACDLIGIGSNSRYQEKRQKILSYSTSPGVVASSIGNLPTWIRRLRILLHYLFRFCGVASQNITGYKGAIASVFVSTEPPTLLDYRYRYTSATSPWGTSYVAASPVHDFDYDSARDLIQNCEITYQMWKSRLQDKVAENI
ncbi:hypothetical protein BX666DRAFT_1995442 [Dichotomocladium elegans]|nr:hypothetical protein BX666DRAFT_1995442 [Dichotomocladium elegans]